MPTSTRPMTGAANAPARGQTVHDYPFALAGRTVDARSVALVRLGATVLAAERDDITPAAR